MPDPIVIAGTVLIATVYLTGTALYRRRRGRAWPVQRTARFTIGLACAALAVVSPLDAAGDATLSAHMVQHLILTNIAAPLLLLGAPVLLAVASTPTATARRLVRVLQSSIVRVLASPLVAWPAFIIALWAIHFTPFFEAALESEPLHALEHALFLGTALWFWAPVIVIGPSPRREGPIGFPSRLLYLLIAMPAEAFLGFAIFGARHVLYAHYRSAGLADQQVAGEIMWIGSGVTMFVAFMLVGFVWAQREQRIAAR